MIIDDLPLIFPGWDRVQGAVVEGMGGRELRVLLRCNVERLHRHAREPYEIANQLAQRPWPKQRSGMRYPGRGMSKQHGTFFNKGKRR